MNSFREIAPVKIIPLGEGYASTSVNTTLCRHHGLVTHARYQFGAYYVSDTEIAVVRRDLRDDTIEAGAIRSRP